MEFPGETVLTFCSLLRAHHASNAPGIIVKKTTPSFGLFENFVFKGKFFFFDQKNNRSF